jgi:hypothetical protein
MGVKLCRNRKLQKHCRYVIVEEEGGRGRPKQLGGGVFGIDHLHLKKYYFAALSPTSKYGRREVLVDQAGRVGCRIWREEACD